MLVCKAEMMAAVAGQATGEAVGGAQETKKYSPKWGGFTLAWEAGRQTIYEDGE